MGAKLFGARIKRIEDPALLTGQGRFVDDMRFPGMVHAAFVRSPHPHARIGSIDASAAFEVDGVHAVYTLADLPERLHDKRLLLLLPNAAITQPVMPHILAKDEVCFVGQAVAMVIADSRYVAEDAAARVAVDYQPLPAAGDALAALKADAPLAHLGTADNVAAKFTVEYGDADAAFAAAPRVFREKLWHHRGCGHALECRGALARYDSIDDRALLWSATQAPHGIKRCIIDLLGWDENRIDVIAPDVGGGFGPKALFYAEEALIPLCAKMLGRPVKWIEDRREHFLTTSQERDQYWDMEAAFDDDGKILAVRGALVHDTGAFIPWGIVSPLIAATTVPGPYIVPSYRLETTAVLTNKVQVTPVRGAGRPQAVFAMERLLDRVASELGLDRAEVRRRNLIPAQEMPYTLDLKSRDGTATTYDSGDYPAAQAALLEAVDYSGFPARQLAARADGRYLGIGIANYVEGTGRGPFDSATVRIGPSGTISVTTGAAAQGQGTKTTLAQVCAAQFGVDIEQISVVAGDTHAIALGLGAHASRQAVTAGSSVHVAAVEVRAKALKVAAHMLEAAESDLDIAGGRVFVKGVPGLSVTLGEIAHAVAGTPGYALPGGITPGLEAEGAFLPATLTYCNGAAAAEVEVDAETGAVRILRYVAVHDSGRLINPMIVDGQVLGGIVHGIGNALYEWMKFDAAGQPQTTNLAEYLLPAAAEMPPIEIIHHQSPTPLNPLGVKGAGEGGTIPAPAAVISAVEDALSPFGVRITESPITPQRIVELIAAGQNRGQNQ